jgi:hypothetical protein
MVWIKVSLAAKMELVMGEKWELTIAYTYPVSSTAGATLTEAIEISILGPDITEEKNF